MAGYDRTRKEPVAAFLDCGFSRGFLALSLSHRLSAHETVSPRLGLSTPGRGRVQFLWVPSPGRLD